MKTYGAVGLNPSEVYRATAAAMYRFAEHLVETGYAYVDEQSADEMRETRGSLTEGGTNSPFRDRPIEESLRLFREMRAGKHPEGSMREQPLMPLQRSSSRVARRSTRGRTTG